MSTTKIDYLKGIHPGFYIAKALKNKKISQINLAKAIDIHHQTLNAIIKTKRAISLTIALKIENYFNWDEGSLMILQLFYDIKNHHNTTTEKPNLNLIRPILFWDTNFDTINWMKNKKSIIKRVLERGNQQEITEISRFYGSKTVSEIRKTLKWNSIE